MRGDSGYVHPDTGTWKNPEGEPKPRIFTLEPTLGPQMETTPKCGTCRFMYEHRCHRHAPSTDLLNRWPLVGCYDWCGEWDGGAR
jgi:hypothetical protein